MEWRYRHTFAVVRAANAARMRHQLQAIEIPLVVVRFVTRVLNDTAVGTHANEADIHDVALPPIPFMELLQRNKPGVQ
jgi:hypothetical protein